MAIVWLSLIGAAIVTAIMVGARVALTRGTRDTTELLRWAGTIFVLNVIVDVLILYTNQPAFTGPYGGWQWLAWPLLLTGIATMALGGAEAGQRMTDRLREGALPFRRVVNATPGRANAAEGLVATGIIAVVVSLLFVLIINSIITIATTWFDPNAKALAAIPNITMSTETKLPPTDVQHIVLVTQDVAAYRGQQVLAQGGQNYGSTYHLDHDAYNLQSINHHLYWVAPLVYNNIFVNLSNPTTPGYVQVDAENPDASAQLVTKYPLRYVPGAILNQDLLRHVYLSGYTYGDLVDATLEIRDDGVPFYTISLMQPSRGFTGEKLYQVLIVDPNSGDITAYAPDKTPDWVDRIIPSQVVADYLGWWGLYHAAPWFNPSGQGQQQTGSGPELVYNNVDQPVWLVPMTSASAQDNSSTGIFLFDTKKNAATFYALNGIGIGDNVKTAFASTQANIRAYDVNSVQLYSIYGRATWVAIYTQSNGSGATFQAIGLLAADDLNGANVQYASSRDAALSLYSSWLASHPSGGTSSGGPSSTGTTQTVAGKVVRIAPTTQNGNTVYYLSIAGQSHIFTASLGISPLLPLVQPGDDISGQYIETGQTVVALTSFTDNSIPLATPTVSPTP